MKHAIMVMGFGNDSKVLQKTIDILDNSDIDFFIHWDKKYKLPNLNSKKSKIIFIPRIRVNWATDRQTLAEKMLMESVIKNNIHYDYVHLISDSDMPLMSVEYFKHFFKKNTAYVGFFDYLEDSMYRRVNYYYPIRHFNVKKNIFGTIILKGLTLINMLLKINRLKNINVEHGCNWFSMDIKYVKKVLNFSNMKMFINTFTSDEFYIQTALPELKPKNFFNKYNYYSGPYRMNKSSKMALRYIDWYRGSPYTFSIEDVEELKKNKNTKYAFARKINNPNLIDKVFSDFYEK